MKPRLTVLTTILLACYSLAGLGQAQETESPSASLYDCGTLSLYTLLQLQDYPIDLRRLESLLRLPTRVATP